MSEWIELPAPADVVIDRAGNVRAFVPVAVKIAGTSTDVTHAADQAGGSSSTGSLFVRSDGSIGSMTARRFFESGQAIEITPEGGLTRLVQLTAASVESGVSAVQARTLTGTGSPEGVVTASPGAVYQQTNGAEGKTFWIKETGTGNTGWRTSRRIVPWHTDLYGPQSQEAFSLVGPTAATYAFPGSALSSSSFEFYSGINPRVLYAVWQVVWTPTNAAAGIELVKFDAGPTNIVQISEITGVTGGPRNDSQDVTVAVKAVVDGQAVATPGVHKQIGHRLKGNGSTAVKVYMSRVSLLLEA